MAIAPREKVMRRNKLIGSPDLATSEDPARGDPPFLATTVCNRISAGPEARQQRLNLHSSQNQLFCDARHILPASHSLSIMGKVKNQGESHDWNSQALRHSGPPSFAISQSGCKAR